MATIKKSRVEQLEKYEEEYFNEFIPLLEKTQRLQEVLTFANERIAQLDEEANFLARHAVKAAIQREEFRNKLWAAEQEVHDLKYDLSRVKDDCKAKVKSWYDFALQESRRASDERNSFRDKAKQDEAVIDDLIEENLDLHFELNLAREIPKMAATVVQFAEDALNRAVNEKIDAINLVSHWSGGTQVTVG